MGTLPLPDQLTDVYTMGALAARVKRWFAEPLKSDQKVYDALNDAIETVWMSVLLATLSKFTSGPVTQTIPANSTSIRLISIPDPTIPIGIEGVPGGNLPIRTEYYSYAYITDSGSMTRIAPLSGNTFLINQVASLPPPLQMPDAIGWVVFAGYNADGSDIGLQSTGLEPFGVNWVEPQVGIAPYPTAPPPPSQNTTGDNIFAIERLEVNNVNMTTTAWIQSNQGSTVWTKMGKIMAGTATSWTPYVYDLVNNDQVQFRPAPGFDLDASLLYVTRPRRLRFPQSRLPFTSFACQKFLANQALADLLMSIYEYEAHDRWNAKAEKELQRIVMQVSQGNWNRDTTVTPFMRA